jgi:hypothetical protein
VSFADGWFARGITRASVPGGVPGGIYGADENGAYVVAAHRATGMGAFQCASVPDAGTLVEVCRYAQATHLGRHDGREVYALAVPPDPIWVQWYRSNSGREAAAVLRGRQVLAEDLAFEEARALVAQALIGPKDEE